MSHLFRFSISPVQSFIEQARKAQDLYAGSCILSKLAREAAEEAERQGIKLVFPQLNTDELPSFPNRFTGRLNGNVSNEELQAKGKAVEEKVKAVFRDEAEKASKKAGYENDPPKNFWSQIESHLDINWLFVPYGDSGVNYKTAFARADALLAAVKNTRFISNPSPEAGRKCSLDGERNALFFGRGSNKKYIKDNQAVVVTQGAWLDENEGLSAVSLMKRAYDAQSFPSTAAVALQKQITQLEKENPGLLECYKKLFSEEYPAACAQLLIDGHLDKINAENKKEDWHTNFDEQFLYAENLTDKNIPNSTQLEITKTLQQQLGPHLSHKYYALICFDVDKMGELLSSLEADAQEKVSEKLTKFSSFVYAQDKKLHTVYAGGDDFLGFINLNYLFETVKLLRTEFDRQVSRPLQTLREQPLTFSMGIAIAHYKTPLHIVLQSARAMQKLAKHEDKGGRDAVAIKILKHSGEGHETYFKWNLKNDALPRWDALQKLTEHLLEDCSDTFIRSLEREFLPLQDGDGNITDKEDHRGDVEEVMGILVKVQKKIQMLPTELLRLAYRSLKEGKKAMALDLRDTIWILFEEEYDMRYRKIFLQNALEALKIAIFIHRKTR